jgi:hypothetical protein
MMRQILLHRRKCAVFKERTRASLTIKLYVDDRRIFKNIYPTMGL